MIRRDEDIGFVFVSLQRNKAEAPRVRMKAADMGKVFHAAVFSSLRNADASLRHEIIQHLLQRGTLRLWDADQHRHFLCLHGLIDRIAYEIDDQPAELFLLIILHIVCYPLT